MRLPGLLFLLLAPGCRSAPAPAAPPPSGIVFVFVDDMGYGDLSCTGNGDVRTAAIDRLAEEGIRFTNFYVASPICSPSRVAITTGRYPRRYRISSYLASRKRNRERKLADFLDPAAPCIARAFKGAGYATAHFGKWHMGGGRDVDDAPLPKAYGFDESLVSFEGLGDRVLPSRKGLSGQSANLGRGKIAYEPKHRLTEIYVDRTIDFIRRHRDGRFYVHLWLNDVHDAHVPKPELLEKYAAFSKNPYVQKFYAVLDEMDRQIGRLMEAIDGMGLGDDTLIVLTSDNGPTDWPKYYREGFDPPGSSGPFRGRKWSLYEGGIRMPLIARWKGRIPAGRVDEATVIGAVDLFPTFCGVAGIPAPEGDGEDMGRALLGTPATRSRPLLWEYGSFAPTLPPGKREHRSPTLAVRDGRWKLLVNADGSRRELYDLGADPAESRNLADAERATADRLAKTVLDWRRSLP